MPSNTSQYAWNAPKFTWASCWFLSSNSFPRTSIPACKFAICLGRLCAIRILISYMRLSHPCSPSLTAKSTSSREGLSFSPLSSPNALSAGSTRVSLISSSGGHAASSKPSSPEPSSREPSSSSFTLSSSATSCSHAAAPFCPSVSSRNCLRTSLATTVVRWRSIARLTESVICCARTAKLSPAHGSIMLITMSFGTCILAVRNSSRVIAKSVITCANRIRFDVNTSLAMSASCIPDAV
mmetsp:Transcript_12225/g.28676  ORF Transcript_12225/g.28676 Transcript_12225/m.28676 type:complete len:239 (+) Transcript_12225:1650-2366(+)